MAILTAYPAPWRIDGEWVIAANDCRIVGIEAGDANDVVFWQCIVEAMNTRPRIVELETALNDTLNMLRAAHMQCGVHHDGNKRVIKARAVLAAKSGAS